MKASSCLLLPLAVAVSALSLPQAVKPRTIEPRISINTILAWISELFPVDVVLEDSTDLILAADEALALALGYGTTSNDLTDSECGDVTLIFARGTDEPGNVGSLVGPEFYAALESALGSTTSIFQGVNDYDASVTEYLEGGSTTGASDMSVFLGLPCWYFNEDGRLTKICNRASLVTQAFSQCPDTQVVMSGYSQGAQVTHLAAADLPAATMEKVSAVVTFGDPGKQLALCLDAARC